MQRTVTIAGKDYAADLLCHEGGSRVWIGKDVYEIKLITHPDGNGELLLNGKSIPVRVARHGKTSFIHAFGQAWEVRVQDIIGGKAAEAAKDSIFAPMPGTTIDVRAKSGDRVGKGQTLLIIESMKLQTEILADRDGTVVEINVRPGQTFDRGALLVRLASEDKKCAA